MSRIDEMGEPYKREYAEELVAGPRARQPHLLSQRRLPGHVRRPPRRHHPGHTARRLQACGNVAGAYWRGDSRNVMMTRIYAWAFENREALDTAVREYELAQERDHKRLRPRARDLHLRRRDWPRTAAVAAERHGHPRRAREARGRARVSSAGYQRVATPHIAKASLYATTGTPGPLSASRCIRPWKWSRKARAARAVKRGLHAAADELPASPQGVCRPNRAATATCRCGLAEYGHVYRWEASGAVSGLARVRGMCMNDAHIYCAEEQIGDVFREVMAQNDEAYSILGLSTTISSASRAGTPMTTPRVARSTSMRPRSGSEPNASSRICFRT